MGDYEQILSNLPKRLRSHNGGNEYVSWEAYAEDGTKVGQKEYVYCYSPIMRALGKYEIHNYPYIGENRVYSDRLHPISYLRYMNLCKKEGLIPSEAKVFIDKEKGNCMVIPRLGWGRHTVYVALCMYRFADICPKNILAGLLLHRKTNLPWLQIFHYLLTKMVMGSGHIFIGVNGSVYGGSYNKDPRVGMALKVFCSLSEEYRTYLGNTGNTIAMFTSMINEIPPVEPFSSVEEILDPKYSRLYTDDSLGAEDLKKIVKSTT